MTEQRDVTALTFESRACPKCGTPGGAGVTHICGPIQTTNTLPVPNPAKRVVGDLDDVRARLADLATLIEPYDIETAERIRDAKMQLAAVQDHLEAKFDV